MNPLTCPNCGGKHAPHFQKCPHCNASLPGLAGNPAGATRIAAEPAVPLREMNMPAAGPQAPTCPCCRGTAGSGKIRIETREYKGAAPGLRPGSRYLVRWVDAPGVCSACMRSLEIKRYIADVLSIVPLVVGFFLTVAFDSKGFLWIVGIYGLYLFKWTWGMSYVWSDLLMYGAQLEGQLGRLAPSGDAGTIRFPSGLWHCLVRIGLIPGMMLALALVGGIFSAVSGSGGNSTAANAPASAGQKNAPVLPKEPDFSSIKDPKERNKARSAWEIEVAKIYLKDATDIAVPVDENTMLMKKDNNARTDMSFYTVFASPAKPPANTAYQLATGPEMLAMFLKTQGRDIDFLRIGGPNLPLSRWQAEKIMVEWPGTKPPTTPVLHSP